MVRHEGPPCPGALGLVMWCQEWGVEPVHYKTGFLGLRGANLRHLPPGLWDLLRRHRDQLRQYLLRRPTPYQGRQRRAG
jgi:hypothetical protein